MLAPGVDASAGVGDRDFVGRRAQQLPIEQVRDLGAVSRERARSLLGSAVDAWYE